MAEGIDPYVECSNKQIGFEQLFRQLITVDANGNPSIRSYGVGLGGIYVEHFVATPGQTVFTLAHDIDKDYLLHKDGAVKQSGHSKTAANEITMDVPLADGTEITITY